MPQPKVSILITTYNRAQYVGRAIQSVLAQNFRDWELIVADDGSTDDTAKTVKEFMAHDMRIKYFPHGHIGRIAKISNFGLAQTRGEYIAILDDDDYWSEQGKLEKQVEFLDKNRDYAACGGGFVTVDAPGRETGRFLKPREDENIRRRLLFANPMANSTMLFRRDAAQKVGNYDETLLQFADWDFWLKMGRVGKLYNFPEYFAHYQMWEKTASFAKQRECARSAWRIIWRHRRFYRGLPMALAFAVSYTAYAYLPNFIKKFLSPFLSRLKKIIFQS